MKHMRASLISTLLSTCLSLVAPNVSDAEPVSATLTRATAADGRSISWKEHLVDDEAAGDTPVRGADGLQMGDFDKDGFNDIVSVHEDSNHVRLAFGSADPDRWFLTTLAEGKEAGAAESAENVVTQGASGGVKISTARSAACTTPSSLAT